MSRRVLCAACFAVLLAFSAVGWLLAWVQQSEPLPPGVQAQVVASYSGDDFPVAMAFMPDGRLLFTEKGGFGGSPHATHVRVIENGVLRPQPWLTLTVVADSERGLLGVAVDPDFQTNRYVYVFYTHPPTHSRPFNRVSRFVDSGGIGINETVLLDIPEVDSEPNHNGGNLHFGPDGKLYVSVGESGGTPSRAQDLANVYGKILRIDKEDGSAPVDNPYFDGSGPNEDRIWAYGLRNPFDFDFDPIGRQMFAIDNGPQCNDEINRVRPGGNYGWPVDADYTGNPCPYLGDPAYVPPLYYWSQTIAPAGVVVYDGDDISEWYGDLLICGSNHSHLYHARLSAARDALISVEQVNLPAGVLCGTDIEVGPDGSIIMLAWTLQGNFVYRLSGPADLRLSRKSIAPSEPQPGDRVTYTIDLVNSGGLAATFALTDTFHPSATLLPGSPSVTSGSLLSTTLALTWSGTISSNAALRLTYAMTIAPAIVSPTVVANMAVVSGAGSSYSLATTILVLGRRGHLPLLLRNAFP